MESYDMYFIAIISLLGLLVNINIKDEDMRFGINSIIIIYALGYITHIIMQYTYT
jgi:hypothetical protein